jgi:hypothetical protein
MRSLPAAALLATLECRETDRGARGKRAEIAPLESPLHPALTLRTCGVMPAKGAYFA